MITDTSLCITEKVIQYVFVFQESFPFACEYPYRNQIFWILIQKVLIWNAFRQMKIVDLFTIVAISLLFTSIGTF